MLRHDAHTVPAARGELGCTLLMVAGFATHVLAFLAGLLGFGKPMIVLLLATPVLALLLWPVLSLFHRAITIGDDGLRLRSWTSGSFHRFADIARISWFPAGLGKLGQLFPWQLVRVQLRSGRTVMLWGLRPRMESIYKEAVARFESYQRLSAVEPPAALRAPAANPKARFEALLQLGSAEVQNLRAAPVDREALWKVAMSAGCEAADRAAAAVALARGADETERWNLRVAAGASAHPKLRVLVNRALDEQLEAEALAETMAELDACSESKRTVV